LLVGDRDTRLSEAEVRPASVIALSGGMLLVSDDMSRLRPNGAANWRRCCRCSARALARSGS
jgi:hypothetical protein